MITPLNSQAVSRVIHMDECKTYFVLCKLSKVKFHSLYLNICLYVCKRVSVEGICYF